MKLRSMKLRTIAFAGVASLAGLGLIGVGAHAVFTTTTASSQTITAGTAGPVYLSSPDVPGCTTVSDDCTSLTFATAGPEGSTFDTPLAPVTITNEGTIPVNESGIQLTDSTNGTPGNYLQDEMDICISSDPGSGPGVGSGGGLLDNATIVANGPLTTGLGLSPSVTLIGPTLAKSGGTDEYQVDFYAGENSLECGTTWSDGGHTASAWSGAGYPSVNPWVTPASLASNAEGGAVDVTLTFTYTG